MAIYELGGIAPQLGEGAFVADSAEVIGHVRLGKNASIWPKTVVRGDKVMLHGCTIGDGSLIGIGAIILNGAKIGKHCLVGAGALVTEGKEFPDGSMILGSPAKAVKQLSPEHIQNIERIADHYVENAARFRASLKKIG